LPVKGRSRLPAGPACLRSGISPASPSRLMPIELPRALVPVALVLMKFPSMLIELAFPSAIPLPESPAIPFLAFADVPPMVSLLSPNRLTSPES
jgi:hypothetical protein